MDFLRYLWKLVCESFHGTFRALEIGEAVTALVVHVIGYLAHEWKEPLERLFLVLLGLLILTFFFGLFIAAWRSQREVEGRERRLAQRLEAESPFYDELTAEVREQMERLSPVETLAVRRLTMFENEEMGDVVDYLRRKGYPDATDAVVRAVHEKCNFVILANGRFPLLDNRMRPYVEALFRGWSPKTA